MNPKQMVMNILQQNMKSDPMLNNWIQMAEKGNVQGLENFAKNICKEKRNGF